jgi:serine/threonine protein kinase
MPYMKNGDLSPYLRENKPSQRLALQWIKALASTIAYVHSCHVIVGDIASRNVLVDDDISAKLCDFGESHLVPTGEDINQAEVESASVGTDIFEFGSVMYEIITGKRYKYNLYDNEEAEMQWREHGEEEGWKPGAEWPQIEDLPDTTQILLSDIIKGCWTKTYPNMADLCQAIEEAIRADRRMANIPKRVKGAWDTSKDRTVSLKCASCRRERLSNLSSHP